MNFDERRAGVLLHITSLPGPHGVGDFGPDAYHFVDWLVSAGQRLWQLLPTTPIGPGDSPYQSVSAFAGSPLMVALEPLVAQGWLEANALNGARFDAQQVDYARVEPWRLSRLREAASGFHANAAAREHDALTAWCAAHAHWLADYTLFMALEVAHGGRPWWEWPQPVRERRPEALAAARREHAAEIAFWEFVQWCFDTQFAALRAYANARDVAMLGDLPIFIAHHSADCWARPDLYELDAQFQPTVVAGVPPDAFTAEGQRWGNPLYRWDRMAGENFGWWTARVRRALAQTDGFRIDHFRGFAAYWEVPADCPTAMQGRWVPGPGAALFEALADALAGALAGAPANALANPLGALPIVAEDLGIITPDVTALREACGFPGMRVMQFAFGGDAGHAYLPHRFEPATVAYTGTHDNDTVQGWWHNAPPRERAFAGSYLATGGDDIHWAMIRAVCNSVANTVVVPLQDVLGLDGSHRMNRPGSPTGNWAWRFDWAMVGAERARVLGVISAASGRGPFARLDLPGELG